MNSIRDFIRIIENARINEVRAFHGSKSKDSVFKIGHAGNNSHTFGAYSSTRYGVFFTTNPEFAKMYGDVEEYEIDIGSTIDLEHNNNYEMGQMAFIKSLNAFDPIERPIWQAARHLRDTWEFFEDEVGERFVPWLIKQGYDSAVFTEYNKDDNGVEHESKTIVVLDPSLIHRIK